MTDEAVRLHVVCETMLTSKQPSAAPSKLPELVVITVRKNVSNKSLAKQFSQFFRIASEYTSFSKCGTTDYCTGKESMHLIMLPSVYPQIIKRKMFFSVEGCSGIAHHKWKQPGFMTHFYCD